MYVPALMCTGVCTCMYFIGACVYIYVCAHMCVRLCVCVCLHACAFMCVCASVFACVCMCVCFKCVF